MTLPCPATVTRQAHLNRAGHMNVFGPQGGEDDKLTAGVETTGLVVSGGIVFRAMSRGNAAMLPDSPPVNAGPDADVPVAHAMSGKVIRRRKDLAVVRERQVRPKSGIVHRDVELGFREELTSGQLCRYSQGTLLR